MSTIFGFILFLITVIWLWFGSHFFLYVTFVSFFWITDNYVKGMIGMWLTILSASFFIASILAHWKDTLFTRGLYVISATWLGFLTYLVLFSIFAWGILYIGSLFDTNIQKIWLGVGVILCSALISIYGLWNATEIRTTQITVPIPNLDPAWQGKRIVHISDVHLGHVLRQDFLWEIVDRINAIKPELVCITGDFFDGMDGSLEHLAEPLNDIQSPKGVFYVDGNHEVYLGTGRTLEAIRETKARVLDNEVVTVDGLQIVGVSFLEGKWTTEKLRPIEAARRIEGFDQKKPFVFLYHKPFRMKDSDSIGPGLMLAGHTHEGQFFPYNLIVKAMFRNFAYGLTKIGDMHVYVSSGVGTWGPPMRVATIPEIVSIELVRAE